MTRAVNGMFARLIDLDTGGETPLKELLKIYPSDFQVIADGVTINKANHEDLLGKTLIYTGVTDGTVTFSDVADNEVYSPHKMFNFYCVSTGGLTIVSDSTDRKMPDLSQSVHIKSGDALTFQGAEISGGKFFLNPLGYQDRRGQIAGDAATVAALPDPAKSKDEYAILTAADGANAKGFYKSNGTAWSKILEVT